MPDRHFGSITGVEVGALFENRVELAEAGVHKPRQAGISGSGSEGADSIVVSGGYEDGRMSRRRMLSLAAIPGRT